MNSILMAYLGEDVIKGIEAGAKPSDIAKAGFSRAHLVAKKVPIHPKQGKPYMKTVYVNPAVHEEGKEIHVDPEDKTIKNSKKIRIMISYGIEDPQVIKELTGTGIGEVHRILVRHQEEQGTASNMKYKIVNEPSGEKGDAPVKEPEVEVVSDPDPVEKKSKPISELAKMKAGLTSVKTRYKKLGTDRQQVSLERIVTRFKKNEIKFGIVYGKGGLGKSFVTEAILGGAGKEGYKKIVFGSADSSLGNLRKFDPNKAAENPEYYNSKDYDYVTLTGTTTPNDLVSHLYAHRDKRVILDDMDKGWRDDNLINILKGLTILDKSGKNEVVVSKNAVDRTKAKGADKKTPYIGGGFSFNGSILALTNLTNKDWEGDKLQPIASRARETASLINMTRTTAEQMDIVKNTIKAAGITVNSRVYEDAKEGAKEDIGRQKLVEYTLGKEQEKLITDFYFGEEGNPSSPSFFKYIPQPLREFRTLISGAGQQFLNALQSVVGGVDTGDNKSVGELYDSQWNNATPEQREEIKDELYSNLYAALELHEDHLEKAFGIGLNRLMKSDRVVQYRPGFVLTKASMWGRFRGAVSNDTNPLEMLKGIGVATDPYGNKVLVENGHM